MDTFFKSKLTFQEREAPVLSLLLHNQYLSSGFSQRSVLSRRTVCVWPVGLLGWPPQLFQILVIGFVAFASQRRVVSLRVVVLSACDCV